MREQGGKEGHRAVGSGSADPLARPSSKSENSPQATLIWSCSFCLKDKGHCPLHPAMLELQPGGQRKQDALTAHKASISRHTTAHSMRLPRGKAFPPGASSARKTVRWTVFSENGPAGPRGCQHPLMLTEGFFFSMRNEKNPTTASCPPPLERGGRITG